MEPRNLPTTMWAQCPIRSSLGVLGRRWSLLILRDVSFFERTRFSDMLRMNKGLSARVLSVRLKELQEEGLIERVEDPENARDVHYALTVKGRDTIPILSAFISYGAKHRAFDVFADKKPRTMTQLFPGDRKYMLGQLYGYVASDQGRPRPVPKLAPPATPRTPRGAGRS